MGFQLQPQDIADGMTLEQINARITSILTALENAEASFKDEFGDGQGNQAVTRQKIDRLNSSLAIWIKAKNILNGEDSSAADLTTINYNPSVPRI